MTVFIFTRGRDYNETTGLCFYQFIYPTTMTYTEDVDDVIHNNELNL